MTTNLDRIGPADHSTCGPWCSRAVKREMPKAEGLVLRASLRTNLSPEYEVLAVRRNWKPGLGTVGVFASPATVAPRV